MCIGYSAIKTSAMLNQYAIAMPLPWKHFLVPRDFCVKSRSITYADVFSHFLFLAEGVPVRDQLSVVPALVDDIIEKFVPDSASFSKHELDARKLYLAA